MDFFYPFTTRYPYQNRSRNIMLREIMNDELNYECFDCHKGYKTPEYVSLNNAIFLCDDCAEIHRQLPDYISVIVPNRIKNFSNEQLKLLYYGGNRKLLEFISYEYPKLRYLEPEIMYKTEAMEYYRKFIRASAFDLDYPEKPSPNVAYRYNKKVVKKEEKEEKNFINSMQDYIDKEESEPQKINKMGSKGKESPWNNYSNQDFFKLLNKTFGGNFFGNDEEEKDNKFNKTFSNFPQTERMKQQPKIEQKESDNIEMKNEESEKKEEKEENNNNENQEMKDEEKSHPYFKRQSTDLINVPKEEKEKEKENENESDDSFMGESYYKKDEDKSDKMDIEKEDNKTEEPKKEDINIEEPKKDEIKTEETNKEVKKEKPFEKLGSKSEIIFHSKPNINQLGSIEMYPDAEEVFLM